MSIRKSFGSGYGFGLWTGNGESLRSLNLIEDFKVKKNKGEKL